MFSVTQPEDWFYNPHADGNYVVVNQHQPCFWDIPMGAAINGVEVLGLSRFTGCASLIEIVLVPLLLKP